jgi:hypothetical protein
MLIGSWQYIRIMEERYGSIPSSAANQEISSQPSARVIIGEELFHEEGRDNAQQWFAECFVRRLRSYIEFTEREVSNISPAETQALFAGHLNLDLDYGMGFRRFNLTDAISASRYIVRMYLQQEGADGQGMWQEEVRWYRAIQHLLVTTLNCSARGDDATNS